MPATTLAPLSTRKRRKRAKARVSAALSLPETLYLQGLKRAEETDEGNFSGYVRRLINADLKPASSN